MLERVAEDELVGLALAIVFTIVAALLIARLRGREWWPLLGAFVLTMVGRILTVAEDFVQPALCNLLEHAAATSAAALLALFCWRLRRASPDDPAAERRPS